VTFTISWASKLYQIWPQMEYPKRPTIYNAAECLSFFSIQLSDNSTNSFNSPLGMGIIFNR